MLDHKALRERTGLGKAGGGGPAGPRRQRSALVVVVLCAVVAVVVAAGYWSSSGRVLDGVSVAGVDVGGKTPAEARAVVENVMAGRLGEVPVTGGPRDVGVTGAEIGVVYDPAATVDEAYGIGRTGNVFERLAGRLRALYGGAEVSPEVRYDSGLVAVEVDEIAALVDEEPREATARVEGAEVVVGESREGYRVDVPATMVEVERALEDVTGEARMVGEPLEPAVTTAEAEQAAQKAGRAMDGEAVLSARGQEWVLAPEEIGAGLAFTPEGDSLGVGLDREALREVLSDVYEGLTVEPVEAGYEFQGEEIVTTESQNGQEIDEAKLFSDLEAGLFEGRREYEAPVVVAEPELATAEAEGLKPTQLLGSYRTDYAIVPDTGEREGNLRIASGAISGTFVAPGETFSMNDTVSSLAYNQTKVIINGQETKADGGGLCQVTSTLYMAANYAGLDVTERHPHATQLPYIRPGLDATVWFGDINGQPLDMKFVNTTDGYVMLREYVADDGYIYAEVYGQPNDVEVEMSSTPTRMNEAQSRWITYQKVTRNGKVVSDGIFHKDVYEPLVDEKGKTIPPPEVYVPPVNP